MYRVRVRCKGNAEVIAENVELKEAYEIILNWSKLNNCPTREFMIDELVYEPFSVCTPRDAELRYKRGDYKREHRR